LWSRGLLAFAKARSAFGNAGNPIAFGLPIGTIECRECSVRRRLLFISARLSSGRIADKLNVALNEIPAQLKPDRAALQVVSRKRLISRSVARAYARSVIPLTLRLRKAGGGRNKHERGSNKNFNEQSFHEVTPKLVGTCD
jgi:hypothetical protein